MAKCGTRRDAGMQGCRYGGCCGMVLERVKDRGRGAYSRRSCCCNAALKTLYTMSRRSAWMQRMRGGA